MSNKIMKRNACIQFLSTIANVNAVGLFLWAIIPFGGKTLPQLLAQSWLGSFHVSALFVGLACGLLIAGSILISCWYTAPETE